MEERTAVSVFLIEFECVTAAIPFLPFVRFGRELECVITEGALLWWLYKESSLLGQTSGRIEPNVPCGVWKCSYACNQVSSKLRFGPTELSLCAGTVLTTVLYHK